MTWLPLFYWGYFVEFCNLQFNISNVNISNIFSVRYYMHLCVYRLFSIATPTKRFPFTLWFLEEKKIYFIRSFQSFQRQLCCRLGRIIWPNIYKASFGFEALTYRVTRLQFKVRICENSKVTVSFVFLKLITWARWHTLTDFGF